MEEQYNDTRRRRCYEAALLMKKNEIRTDRKHPLTTPEQASVLRAPFVPLQEFSSRLRRTRGIQTKSLREAECYNMSSFAKEK
jgi:hypothetical protein